MEKLQAKYRKDIADEFSKDELYPLLVKSNFYCGQVMRIPLRIGENDEQISYNAYRFRKSDIINEIKNLRNIQEL